MKKLFFIPFLLLGQFLIAQPKVDSLKSVWNDSSLKDTIRLNAINDFIKLGYLNTQPDSAFFYASIARDFANAINNKKWIVKAINLQGLTKLNTSNYKEALALFLKSYEIGKKIDYNEYLVFVLNNIGIVYYRLSDYDKALKYYNSSLDLYPSKKNQINVYVNMGLVFYEKGDYEKTLNLFSKSIDLLQGSTNKQLLATIYNNSAVVYKNQGLYQKSIELNFKSLKISSQIGDSLNMVMTIGNIGIVYQKLGHLDMALEHYQNALSIEESIGNKSLTAISLENIGEIYLLQDSLNEATIHFEKAIEICKYIESKKGMAASFRNLGKVSVKKQNYNEALLFFNKALSLYETLGSKEESTEVFILKGEVYLKKRQPQKAIKYFTKALVSAKKLKVSPKIERSYYLLYEGYVAIGNYKKALDMHVLFTSTKEKIKYADNSQKLIANEQEYKFEMQAMKDSLLFAKQQALKDLKIKQQFETIKTGQLKQYLLYGGVFILALIMFFVLYGLHQKTKAYSLIEKQKEELESKNDEIERQHIQLLGTNTQISEFNITLESKVQERTEELEKSIKQLRYYHNDLSHNVRAPLATLMGLINLIQDYRFDTKENEKVLRLLSINSAKIDKVIKSISKNMTTFDEYWEEKMEDDGKSNKT